MTERSSGDRSRSLLDAVALVGMAVVVVGVLLITYAVNDFRFPIGADATVYVWWARLAGHEGLGAVGGRPGVPGLTLLLSGALGAGTATVVAALEVVLTAAVGWAVAALTMRPDRGRLTWLLPATLAAWFSVFLAIGYVSTLAAAVLFLAADVALLHERRAGVILAAAMLAAQGLAHPEFLAIGAGVLLLWAALAFLHDRSRPVRSPLADSEHGRILAAVTAGAGTFLACLAAVGRGAGALSVDTSRDDVVQRLDLGSVLAGEFRRRLLARAPALVPILTVPLAVWGAWITRDALGRLMHAWGAVVVIGGAFAVVTGTFPAERLVTFGFVIPIAAGTALASVPGRIIAGRRIAVWVGTSAVTVAVTAGALLVWFRTPPQLFPLEVQRVTEATRSIELLPPGTPLVFVAKNREAVGAFFATEAANAIRAAVPPDRIRDVLVVVPAGPPLTATVENARLTASGLEAAVDAPGAIWFDLAPFDRTGFGGPLPDGRPPATLVSQGVRIAGGPPSPPGGPASDPLLPTSGRQIGLAAAAVLAIATLSGSGWAGATTGWGVRALALSPAVGVGVLLLAAVGGDLLGLEIEDRAVGVGLVAVVTVGGHAAAFVARRGRSRRNDAVPFPP